MNDIFWVLRSAAPWADLPSRYVPHTTCYNRFRRWTKSGIWDRIMDSITDAYDGDVRMIDGTSVRVHHSAATLKKPPGSKYWTKPGWSYSQTDRQFAKQMSRSLKIHALTDGNGLPVRLTLTPGQTHDAKATYELIHDMVEGQMLLADRAYVANWIRNLLNERGAWANIPPKSNRKTKAVFSPHLYKARNKVERFLNIGSRKEND